MHVLQWSGKGECAAVAQGGYAAAFDLCQGSGCEWYSQLLNVMGFDALYYHSVRLLLDAL
jgi:hypothetical protein